MIQRGGGRGCAPLGGQGACVRVQSGCPAGRGVTEQLTPLGEERRWCGVLGSSGTACLCCLVLYFGCHFGGGTCSNQYICSTLQLLTWVYLPLLTWVYLLLLTSTPSPPVQPSCSHTHPPLPTLFLLPMRFSRVANRELPRGHLCRIAVQFDETFLSCNTS